MTSASSVPAVDVLTRPESESRISSAIVPTGRPEGNGKGDKHACRDDDLTS
jgi:hypothetical protein